MKNIIGIYCNITNHVNIIRLTIITMDTHNIPYHKIYCQELLQNEQIDILEKLKPLILVLENKPDEQNAFIDYVNANYYDDEMLYMRKDYFKRQFIVGLRMDDDDELICCYFDREHTKICEYQQLQNKVPVLGLIEKRDETYIKDLVHDMISFIKLPDFPEMAETASLYILIEKPLLTKHTVAK